MQRHAEAEPKGEPNSHRIAPPLMWLRGRLWGIAPSLHQSLAGSSAHLSRQPSPGKAQELSKDANLRPGDRRWWRMLHRGGWACHAEDAWCGGLSRHRPDRWWRYEARRHSRLECIAVEETIFTNTPCEFNVKDVLPHTVTARALVQPDLCHCLCLCRLLLHTVTARAFAQAGFVPLFARCTRRAARPDRGAQDEGCRMHSTDVASAPRRVQTGTPHGIEHAKHVIFRSVCGFARQGTAREPKRVCLVFGR